MNQAMKVSGVFRIIITIFSSIFIIAGISTVANVSKAEKLGYEQVEFEVVDYEVLEITKYTDRNRTGSTKRRKNRYRINYDVTYEYKWEGETYTYSCNKTKKTRYSTTEPCNIGDIVRYYIDPENPEDSSAFIEYANKKGAIGMIVICSIGLIGVFVWTLVDKKKKQVTTGYAGDNLSQHYTGGNSYSASTGGYGNSQDLYNNQSNYYGNPQNPYGGQQNGYGNPQNPYGGQQNGYGNPQNPFGGQ